MQPGVCMQARKLHRAEEDMRRVKKLKSVDLPASEQSREALRTEQNLLRGHLDNERSVLTFPPRGVG